VLAPEMQHVDQLRIAVAELVLVHRRVIRTRAGT
jgi:hypothetical protein